MRSPDTLFEALQDVAATVSGILHEHDSLLDFDPGKNPDGLPLVEVATETPTVRNCDSVVAWPAQVTPIIASNVQAGTEATCTYQTSVTFNIRACVCYPLEVEDPTPEESAALAKRYLAVIWTIWAGLLNAGSIDSGIIDGVSCSDVTFSTPVDLGPRESGIICGTIAVTARLKAERITL